MKTLFKKSLLVLMVAFIAVFTLGVTSKVKAVDTEITFNLGANGSASHNDGSSATTYSETVDGYTLSITNGTKAYKGARDAKGNSCLKLGTSSAVGSFKFTVPDDITSVKIYAAKYKTNTTKLSVNGTTTTLTKNSNNGEYDVIDVVTTTSKTVSVTTVSGGVRCMINTIVFCKVEESEEPSDHNCEPCERCNKCLLSNCPNLKCEGHTIKFSSTEDYTTMGVEKDLTFDKIGFDEIDPVWESSNEEVAVVDENGKVTPKSLGKTTITATVVDSIGSESAKITLYVYPIADSTITIEEALKVGSYMDHNTYTPNKYYVEGTITEVYNTTYGNLYITDGSNKFTIYGLYSADGKTRYDAMTLKPIAGDNIKVYGNLGQYNGAPQIKNGWLIEHTEKDENISKIKEALNSVEAKMSIAYKYNVSQGEIIVDKTSSITDTLTRETTGVSEGSSTYTSWNSKTSESSAVYAGLSAGGESKDNPSLQIRNKNKNEGIITTTSGGVAIKVSVKWNSATTSGRVLNIYGSNSAYSATTDLFDTNKQGTLLGTIVNGTSTELLLDGEYEYIGLCSNDGAMYFDSIEITWETTTGETETQIGDIYSNVNFLLKCGIQNSIENLVELPEDKSYTWGIEITDGTNPKRYTENDETNFIMKDETNGINYVVISLGDVLNNTNYAKKEFTVKAFVEYEGVRYYTTNEDNIKTYSVVSILSYYQSEVELNAEQQESIDAVVALLEKLGC